MKKRHLIVMLIILSIVSIFLGAKSINIIDILSGNKEALHLMAISRLPRLISILMAGSAMSICGLIMQQISQNKFVSPTTGATIDSAKLGIVIAMVLIPEATTMQKAMVSFVFALSGTLIFMTFGGAPLVFIWLSHFYVPQYDLGVDRQVKVKKKRGKKHE